MSEEDETDALVKELQEQYPAVRKLPDGSIAAICPLITTTAVILGVNRDGWGQRFCFRRTLTAYRVFDELQSEDDEPKGWIARRP